MIKFKQAVILWSEGLAEENIKFTSLKSLQEKLLEISRKAPKTGGYDKTKISLEWEDGNTYLGRWDIKHPSQINNDASIKEHILSMAEYLIWDASIKEHILSMAEYLIETNQADEFLKKLVAGKYQLTHNQEPNDQTTFSKKEQTALNLFISANETIEPLAANLSKVVNQVGDFGFALEDVRRKLSQFTYELNKLQVKISRGNFR